MDKPVETLSNPLKQSDYFDFIPVPGVTVAPQNVPGADPVFIRNWRAGKAGRAA